MKKLIALFGVLALAACGGEGGDTAVVEDTTVVPAATEPAPIVTEPMVTDTAMVVDTTFGATDTMTDTAATTQP